MRNILRSRNMVVAGASFALIAGMTGASIALSSGPAGATACGTPNISTCTATGTLTVTPGNLTFTTPASLAWTSLLNGLGQSVVDTRPGDQVATVDDASGTQAGWRVSGDRNHVHQQRLHHEQHLARCRTFSVTGSVTSPTSPTIPTISCVVLNTCTLPRPEWRRHLPPCRSPRRPRAQLRPSSAMRSRGPESEMSNWVGAPRRPRSAGG